jgi:stage V sporulation protein SpoVS
MPIDLVNRFALTHLHGTFNVFGKVISVATNCPDLLGRIADLARECGQADVGQPDCSWRIVTEPKTDEASKAVAVSSRRISDDGISFVTIGQYSFLAYDERTRKGVSFLSEALVSDRTLFVEAFLPGFLSLLPEGKR